MQTVVIIPSKLFLGLMRSHGTESHVGRLGERGPTLAGAEIFPSQVVSSCVKLCQVLLSFVNFFQAIRSLREP